MFENHDVASGDSGAPLIPLKAKQDKPTKVKFSNLTRIPHITTGLPNLNSNSNCSFPRSPATRAKSLMMAFARDVTILSAMTAGLVALVVGFILADHSPTSTLYCTANPTLAHITTLNASLPHAQCFRVKDGIFAEVLDKIPADEQFTLLDGHVIPGIIESHGHILQYGEMLESVSLYGAASMDEVKSRIKEWLNKHESEGYGSRNKWIRGIGWDQAYFGGVMPTAVSQTSDLMRI
jgi:hypothetical protein